LSFDAATLLMLFFTLLPRHYFTFTRCHYAIFDCHMPPMMLRHATPRFARCHFRAAPLLLIICRRRHFRHYIAAELYCRDTDYYAID